MGQQPEQASNQEDLDSNGGIQAETAATAAEKATSRSSDPTSDSLKQARVEVMTSFKSRIESWSETRGQSASGIHTDRQPNRATDEC